VAFGERRPFRDTRPWLCGRAEGQTLEVAVGTGLDLPHYPSGVRLTGLERGPRMLELARHRADRIGRRADLRLGDAHGLPFPGARFDTVVCTFSLCCVQDDRRAPAEMARVLRPGGLLLLADHVPSTLPPVPVLQALADRVSVRRTGEHFCGRPLLAVRALGLAVEQSDRFSLGIIERPAARRP
jgi:ubiquinone/menaquinone biosynthesis C-methylase UbiE